MNVPQSFSVKLITRANKAKKGMYPLHLKIKVDQKIAELSLKRYINPKLWDQRRNAISGQSTECKMLIQYIEQVKKGIMDTYDKLMMQRREITADIIKNEFLGIDMLETQHTIVELFHYHNEVMKTTLAPGTMKNYFTTLKYINRFIKVKYKKNDLSLKDISYKFITEFEFFLRNWKPTDHQKPLSNNGVMKHLERLRKVANFGTSIEWLEQHPFSNFKLKFKKKERAFLNQNDLESIESKTFDIYRMQLARDLFVFSCYTGLAYIDMQNLRPDNISKGIDGNDWILTKRAKTDIGTRIPLLPKAKTILDKYRDDPRSVSNGTIFPKISNQKLNAYLKELADICQIDKYLTFHLARHTFATTVTLLNGVPIETVSKLLGHTKITTTQIYAKAEFVGRSALFRKNIDARSSSAPYPPAHPPTSAVPPCIYHSLSFYLRSSGCSYHFVHLFCFTHSLPPHTQPPLPPSPIMVSLRESYFWGQPLCLVFASLLVAAGCSVGYCSGYDGLDHPFHGVAGIVTPSPQD